MKITGQAGMRRQGRNGPGATRGQWVREGQRTGRACERDVGHGGPQHSVRLKGGSETRRCLVSAPRGTVRRRAPCCWKGGVGEAGGQAEL